MLILVRAVEAARRVLGCRTWHVESAFVLAVLAAVALAKPWQPVPLLGKDATFPVEWIVGAAVWLTFGHASIAVRLQEAEERRATFEVPCHWKLVWYFVSKEVLWATSFVLLGAWSGLVGVGIFLLYPLWRRAWRRRHPLPPPDPGRAPPGVVHVVLRGELFHGPGMPLEGQVAVVGAFRTRDEAEGEAGRLQAARHKNCVYFVKSARIGEEGPCRT